MLSSNASSEALDASRLDPHQLQPDDSTDRYIYKLFVVQQPLRARMCGFGEKDRRPCTPPPILQLIIYDSQTLQRVDVKHIETSFFTATCSLFSVDMEVDMDLIRQRAGQDFPLGLPFIPASNTAQKPMQQPATTDNRNSSIISSWGSPNDSGDQATRSSSTNSTSKAVTLGQNAASSASIMSFSAGSRTDSGGNNGAYSGGHSSCSDGYTDNMDSSVCTVRNLIGASVATGAKLNNTDGSLGIFFVFPDLSIRKDGEYRFKFSFFDLQSKTGGLIQIATPIKAYAFSEPFRVYSAKQFPGMIESTPLSRHFAKQGVKIPVRKESGKSNLGGEDDDWGN
ncbi:velvet factor [Coemansia spiralis]|nr:velvet factor [Coemansia spiralis]